jgi:exonuclease III
LGIEKHDDEGRVLTLEFKDFYLVTVYAPNAGFFMKRLAYRVNEWEPDFREFLNNLKKKKPTVLCGDLNVSH